jgi:hypothetical protein
MIDRSPIALWTLNNFGDAFSLFGQAPGKKNNTTKTYDHGK